MIFLLTLMAVLGLSCISGMSVFLELEIPNDKTSFKLMILFVYFYRKSTFDMFNFLASQHRQLPDIGPYDDEEDEVLLKSTRSGFTFWIWSVFCVQMFQMFEYHVSFSDEPLVWSYPWPCASDTWREHPKRPWESTGQINGVKLKKLFSLECTHALSLDLTTQPLKVKKPNLQLFKTAAGPTETAVYTETCVGSLLHARVLHF